MRRKDGDGHIATPGFLTADEGRKRSRAALTSVVAALVLILAKLIAGLLSGSLALISEAAHSGADLAAALVTYYAVRSASKPPDTEHHFGHAKYESVGALLEVSFLVVVALGIMYSAIQRLRFGSPPLELGPLAIGLVCVSVSVDIWRTTTLRRAAKRSGSEALEASAFHFLSDLLGTSVVVVGLISVALGLTEADGIAAVIISLIILVLSVNLGRRIMYTLTDRAPAGVALDVEHAVRHVPNVIGVHDIRVRKAGAQYFTEMHVDLSPHLPLEQVHEVLDRIETSVRTLYPTMHIVTHPEPSETPTDSYFAR